MISIHSSPLAEIGSRETGGMSVYLLENSRNIGKMGHEVDLVTLAAYGEETSIEQLFENVWLVRLSNTFLPQPSKDKLLGKMPELALSFGRFLKAQKRSYSVVHSHYWLSGILTNLVESMLNCPHIVTFHTLADVKNRASRNNDEPYIRIENETALAAACDGIISFTQQEKNYLASLKGTVSERIYVVPCGVNQDVFQPANVYCKSVELEWLGSQLKLLYVGRFVKIKGIEVLLKALSKLQHYPVCLFLAGGDDELSREYQELVKKADELGIGDRINFLGRVDHAELAHYYSAADVVIVPSLHESFGLVAAESLSCGTPVIGTHVGGMVDVVKDGAGLLVPPGDVSALSQAIEDIIVSNASQIMTSSELRRSVAWLSWRSTANQMVEIYREELNRMGAVSEK